MKHTIMILAVLNLASAAQAALIAPTRVSLPGARAPQIAINPRIQLPKPTVPVLPLTTVRLQAPVAAPTPIMLPGVFNPNSPVVFPTVSNENNGKVVAQLGALFDGSAAKEIPAVPVDAKAEKSPVEKAQAPVVRAEKGDHLTLPENDLLNEIGL